MSNITIEMVQFRLKPGVDEATFLATVADTQGAIARLPGMLKREVLKGEDGLWIDLVHWRTRAEALAAAEAFMTMPEGAALAALLDETQLTMLHLDLAGEYA